MQHIRNDNVAMSKRTHFFEEQGGQSKGIYVEIPIKASIDQLWNFTQSPDLHQQWDLRFSTITYLPKLHADEPQRFRYLTRIGFGLAISGMGESVATRINHANRRHSSLKFWSDHPLSLISFGSGYWQYVVDGEQIMFATWFDYDIRHGWFGRVLDVMGFRPIFGWITALSFDCLRIWLEENIHPRRSLLAFALHHLVRIAMLIGTVAFLLSPSIVLALFISACFVSSQFIQKMMIPTAARCIRQRRKT